MSKHGQLLVPVTGMTCSACAARIEKALNKAEGIVDARVNFATEKADISWDTALLNSAGVSELIRKTGFGVGQEYFSLNVGGMTCSACAARIEKVLNKLPGVTEATVNFALESASISSISNSIKNADLISAIEGAGFTATTQTHSSATTEDNDQKLAAEEKTLKISIALTAPLVLQMIMQFLGFENFHLTPEAQVLLATPVQFVFGARFYKAAMNALRAHSANMDVLVVMGTTSAYIYSWYLMLALGENAEKELYFEASAVIITLVLLGKFLEARAKRSTTEAIRKLMDLRPEVATVIRNNQEQSVPIDEVAHGDLVLVKPGANIPVDGIVTEGQSEVDESLITGESIPVLKSTGDEVTGGAVNTAGRLVIEATTIGQDSTLARIIQLIENAQAGKAPVQRLVDRVSEIFVPVVIVIAALTFGIGYLISDDAGGSLIGAVSVLVIACPCALGLATPTAIMTGTGAAAQAGILIRDVESLEQAHELDAIIFDKTGTLTEGRPEVTQLHAFNGEEEELIRLTASVQQGSEHPLANAILRLATERGIQLSDLSDFTTTTGSGISAIVEKRNICIGRHGYISEQGSDLTMADDIAELWEERGNTVIWVIADKTLLGLFAIADQLRETSAGAVGRLRTMNIKTLLLSGDSEKVANLIGETAGIDEAHGGVLPGEKADQVKKLTQQGYHVGMIGDGINDAPALAEAHVGIAMGTGTDIAMETASITLMRSDPRLVPAAVEISRATWNKIRQNLFWAFIYNVIGIPLAAFGMLSPTLAGAAMALSSVSVVSNSLLLKSWQPWFNKRG
ncbi:MAG: heavy metal translocating P-type ATPase [Gammaproteobacteria bacterium]